jgi:type IV secretory pathway component VirB8
MDGAQPVETRWVATIDYRVDAPVPAESRLFNPMGVFVTKYFVKEDGPK